MKRLIAIALMGLILFAGLPAKTAWAAPSAQNLTAQDRTAMNKVVDKYQKTVFDSYFGTPVKVPASIFTTDGIQKELNAKNKCTALSRRGARVVIKESHYEMNQVVAEENWARFTLTRTLKIETTRDGKTTATNESTTEGYLMKKSQGKWQIDNVFINPGQRTQTMQAFMATNNLEKFNYNNYSIQKSSGLDYEALARELSGGNTPVDPSPQPPAGPGNKDVHIVINGEEVTPKDAKPYIKNNRTMVPMRLVSEHLDAEVVWDGADQSITLTTAGGQIYGFAVGRASYAHGSRVIDMDVAPEITDSRTMLPLRAVGEIFGEVIWDATSRTVTINTDVAPSTSGNDTYGITRSLDGLSDGIATALRGKVMAVDSNCFIDATAKTAINDALGRLAQKHKDEVVVSMDMTIKAPDITATDRFARAIIDIDCSLALMDPNGNTYPVDAALGEVAVLLEKDTNGTWFINNAFFNTNTSLGEKFKKATSSQLQNYRYAEVSFNRSLGI